MDLPEALIELDDVSFSYADQLKHQAAPALSHISLELAPGEMLGILGPSGAGKSTLASVISGAIPHHFTGRFYGSCKVCGQDTCEATLTDIASLVGSVLQDIDAQMVASIVEDELLFGLENFGVPHERIEERLAGALEAVGISNLRHREIATLSGGQKQKVAVAAILALRPQVLVLDEPTAALDPASSKLIFDTLAQVRAQYNIAVVLIEQKVALLSTYCDRIAVLNQGKLAFCGTPQEVFAHAEELEAMGVNSPRTARVYNQLRAANALPHNQPLTLSVNKTAALIGSLVPHQKAGSTPSRSLTAEKNPAAGNASQTQVHSGQPVVEMRDLSFTYAGTNDGIAHINLAVWPGEVVGIIGQNGAGKTTLSKILCGLLRAQQGTARVADLDLSRAPVSKIAGHVATLFQNPDRQLCKNTVDDEVAFGLELQGIPRTQALERARRVVDTFGLPHEASPFTLSRGQRQMVALAAVVVVEPDVILLDEPTSSLDYQECMTVMQTVAVLAEQGCAVVMICHDMEVVSDFAERLYVMAKGHIVGEGSCEQVFSQPELLKAAAVEAPQALQLAELLSHEVSPAFASATTTQELVSTTLELMHRG